MPNNVKIPAVIPVIAVDDIRQAIIFYKQLGFNEEEAFSFSDENGRLVHAHLYKDESVIFLGLTDVSYYKGKPRAKRIEEAQPAERGLGITLILQSDNLNEIYDLVRKAGLDVLYEPTDEWYGDRVFLFVDPFGYEWKVSQPL